MHDTSSQIAARPRTLSTGLQTLLVLAVASAVACGDDPEEPGNSSDASADGSVGTGGGTLEGDGGETGGDSGTTGGTATDDAGSGDGDGDGDGDTGPVDPDDGDPAADIDLTDLLINQGVQTELVLGGAFVPPASRTAVVIGGRGGIVQARWATGPGFVPRELEARLTIYPPGAEPIVHSQTGFVSGPPGAIGSEGAGFSWVLAGDEFPGGAEFSVGLYETTVGGTGTVSAPRFPSAGSQPLQVDGDDITMKLVLVPSLDCGGSPLQWTQTLQDHIANMTYNMFPISNLEVTFHEPASGVGCDPYDPTGVGTLRDQENLGPEYYYQLVLDEVQSNCGGGYAYFAGTEPDGYRISSMGAFCWPMDFSNSSHELAHNLDRDHSFSDPSYPGNGSYGEITTWGYGLANGILGGGNAPVEMQGTFFSPPEYYDITSYDNPHWVSAYTYNGMFPIIQAVSSWSSDTSEEGRARLEAHHRGRMLRGVKRPDGAWKWELTAGNPRVSSPDDQENHAVLVGEDGTRTRVGIRHLVGVSGHDAPEVAGVVLKLAGEAPVSAIELVIEGEEKRVAWEQIADLRPTAP